MSDSCRRSLFFLFSFVAIMIFSATAFAECDTDCDPLFSHCGDTCQICTHYNQDGCDGWRDSTCGDQMASCLQDGCYPNWTETSRVTQGTYDGVSFSHCNHHLVQFVTRNDTNHCNTNSTYWTYSFCDNVLDVWRNQCCWPPCCDRWGDNGTYMTCDGNHSCTG